MKQLPLAVAALLLGGSAFAQTSLDTARIETHLTAFDAVRYSESQLAEAEDYLAQELQQMGYEIERVTSTRSGVQGSSDNISARIPGTAHTCLVAHYDTVAGSPGVADNGAAVAAMLEIARVAKSWTTFDRGVVFLFSTFEEDGLQGSNDWLAATENSGLCDRAISLDSIGWECDEPGCAAPYVDFSATWCSAGDNVDFEPECDANCDGTHVKVVSNTASNALAQTVGYHIGTRRAVVNSEVLGFCGLLQPFRRSDHANFWDEGIPAVLISSGASDRSSCYHGGSDTRDCPEWSLDLVLDIAHSTLDWLAEDLDIVLEPSAAQNPLNLGDFNGDARSDALLRDTLDGNWEMTLLDGFTPLAGGIPPINSSTEFALQAIADFNGDGKDDVLVRSREAGSWRIFLMDGLQRIGAANPPVNRSDRLVLHTVADFNGDMRADLLLRNLDAGNMRLFLLDGFSAIGVGNLQIPASHAWEWMGFPDLDGDGNLDILTRHTLTGVWKAYRMVGFAPVDEGILDLPTAAGFGKPQLGDFDGDGLDDILLHDDPGGTWHLFLMDGLTVRQAGSVSPAPNDQFVLELAGDFDGSGSTDLLMREPETGTWYLSLMDGLEVIDQGTPPVNGSLEFQPAASSDFDGDGKDDILLYNPGNGYWRLFLMDGVSRKDVQNLPVALP